MRLGRETGLRTPVRLHDSLVARPALGHRRRRPRGGILREPVARLLQDRELVDCEPKATVRANDLDEALALGKQCEYGNGACIFTRSGWAAREFKRRFNAGMIGMAVILVIATGIAGALKLVTQKI